jgi:hypothetical protein
MRFQINRSSQGAVSKRPPCAGAIRGPEAAAWPGEFRWFVELSSLEELVRFLDDNGGGLGMWSAEEGEGCPAIEIYDEDEAT